MSDHLPNTDYQDYLQKVARRRTLTRHIASAVATVAGALAFVGTFHLVSGLGIEPAHRVMIAFNALLLTVVGVAAIAYVLWMRVIRPRRPIV